MDADALAAVQQANADMHPHDIARVIGAYLSHRPTLAEFAPHDELRTALDSICGWFSKHGETEMVERATFVIEDVRRLLVEVEEIARLSEAALQARKAALAEVKQSRANIIQARSDAIDDVAAMLEEHLKSGTSGTRALALTLRASLDTLRTKP
jgi:hypothetical protein